MRIDKNPRRKLFSLDKAKIAHLNACAAQNLSLAKACEELKCDPKTLKNAARREGLYDWLTARFPGYGYQVQKTSGPIANPDTESLYFKAATMPWRRHKHTQRV